MRHAIRMMALALALGLSGPVVAGPFEDGLAAAQKGDHATALRLWHPLADQGNAFAQYNLGIMYDNGKGVPQDYVQAVKWYGMAAKQGYASAQLNLGVMYAEGRGVPQDYVQAHKWFNLGATGGDKNAVTGRDRVAKLMTPAQIAEAQKLAREWKPK